jgi:hypothetical protein
MTLYESALALDSGFAMARAIRRIFVTDSRVA